MDRPSCEGCGACCLNCGPGVMNDAGILSEPPIPCDWLDLKTKKCKDYDRRPKVCREEYLPGDEACMVARARFGVDPMIPCRGHDLKDYRCSPEYRPQVCKDWLATRLSATLHGEACREIRARYANASTGPLAP